MAVRRSNNTGLTGQLIRSGLIFAIAVGALFYGFGGWIYSDLLHEEALEIKPYERLHEVRVTSVGDGTIGLSDPEDYWIDRDGFYGVIWDGGSGVIGEIVETVGDTVIRDYVAIEGELEPGDMVDIDPWMWDDPMTGLGLEFETVSYESELGPLGAWYIGAAGDDWVIALHGKGGDRREALRFAGIANFAGYDVLMVDYRNDPDTDHDPSGIYQYGVTEWRDVEAAIDYALDQGADRIVLAGFSTGAALAFSFMAESVFSEEVDLLFVESPNLDMEQTVRHGAAQTTLPGLPFMTPDSMSTAAIWVAERRYGINFDDWDYIEGAADVIEVPVLVIHGTKDLTVPVEVALALEDELPDLVTLEEFPDADHVSSWNLDRTRYRDVVLAFLSEE